MGAAAVSRFALPIRLWMANCRFSSARQLADEDEGWRQQRRNFAVAKQREINAHSKAARVDSRSQKKARQTSKIQRQSFLSIFY